MNNLEYVVEMNNLEYVVEMIAQAFIKMVDEQPSDGCFYDYELNFKDYNGIQGQTLLPA